jgi:hypothetical protein
MVKGSSWEIKAAGLAHPGSLWDAHVKAGDIFVVLIVGHRCGA